MSVALPTFPRARLFVVSHRREPSIDALIDEGYDLVYLGDRPHPGDLHGELDAAFVLVDFDGSAAAQQRLRHALALLGGRVPVVACCEADAHVPMAMEAGADDFIILYDRQVFRARFDALLRNNARNDMLRRVLDSTFDGIVTIDAQGRIVGFNRAASAIFGYSEQEAWGQRVSLLMPAEYAEHHDQYLQRYLSTGESRIIGIGRELTGQRKNGETFPLFLQLSHIREPSGDYFVGVLKDRSVEAHNRTLLHEVNHDPLTGLPNRRCFLERLQRCANTARDAGHGLAVLFVDLDHFKELNDTLGHDVGDRLLCHVAMRLSTGVRASDTVARLSGDEFVVLLARVEGPAQRVVEEACRVADMLLAELNAPMLLQGREYRCRASIGVSILGPEDRPEELMKRADAAMYEAKRTGRNTVCLFDPTVPDRERERRSLEADLRQALAARQFSLHLQPQVDATGAILGAEALLRWQHPRRGWISPADFIPLAEECGEIVSIGHWVVESATRLLMRWQQQPGLRHLQLGINVSARQFAESRFAERVLAQVQHSGIDPARLDLELTESIFLALDEATLRQIQALRDSGLRLSMDDFGTGYSSLSFLSRLPLDRLKIDRAFVSNIGLSRRDEVIAQTIVGMANSLGMEVMAEGVETGAQRDFLMRNDCHLFQGFLFGRPMPVTQFEALCSGAAAPDCRGVA